ncbi:MAG: peptide ABC transporter substrate-binding protein, partial [Rhodospirillales bacterium]|nr:peptide ABC transporter substrate-binding protein [Rhodospirillales bacterium]
MIERVKAGRMSRRGFLQRMSAVGLTAPMASQLLALGGVSIAAAAPAQAATKRGGGGVLKLLWWQAPTLLNPHFATGTKDQDGSRVFYEPLANWDNEGNLVPVLAAEIPSIENGGLTEEGTSVIWKIKKGVTFHDGHPLTADDLVFNWEYCKDPATAAVTSGSYINIKVEKIDDHSVKVIFAKPTPFWADAFVGINGMIIPKHLFADYSGAKSRNAPNNLKPVGTGPFKFKSFNPGDLVSGEIYEGYHVANQPAFDGIEMKGGGDAVSAARAVLQTGEYQYAWNLQVEDEILKKLEAAGKGKVHLTAGANIEHIQINFTDPNKEVDGERSSIKTKHPSLSDPAVREALALLIDRKSVQDFIYGRTAQATANYVNGPPRYVSKNTSFEFNIQKAIAILDKAGWKPGPDGIRTKNGAKMQYLFQTSINQPRQKNQAIVKQACQKAGIGIEIKSVVASVYFSSDVGNNDTYPHFYADLQMYTTGPGRPDPAQWMRSFLSEEVATKANKWQGRNITRWQNKEYDATWNASENEMNPVKRAALLIKLNDLVIKNNVVIPELFRLSVSAAAKNLNVTLSGWDSDTANLRAWHIV